MPSSTRSVPLFRVGARDENNVNIGPVGCFEAREPKDQLAVLLLINRRTASGVVHLAVERPSLYRLCAGAGIGINQQQRSECECQHSQCAGGNLLYVRGQFE